MQILVGVHLQILMKMIGNIIYSIVSDKDIMFYKLIFCRSDASATDLNHSPYQKDEKGNYQFDKLNDSYFNHARSMCEVAKEYGFELALVVYGVIMYQRHGQIIC